MYIHQLSVERLTLVRGNRALFTELGFSLVSGDLLYVTGENGAGKSSLLRILAGLLSPDEGCMLCNGIEVSQQAEDYRRGFLFLSHLTGLKDELTVMENLVFMLNLSGIQPLLGQVEQALHAVGLQAYQHDKVAGLSQGQRRRVALAKLWLSDAAVWLLDEPFVALDTESVELVKEKIKAHLQAGGIVVLTTHQEVHIEVQQFHQLKIAA